ncbi:ammonium transporter [Meredithblackwellia eburnea MCA 4105]
MVNITYGALQAQAEQAAPGSNYNIVPSGTDLIATLPDGTTVAYSPGDIGWVLACAALVWLMIPGVGYLYSGLVRRKNALTLLLLAMLAVGITSFQWFFWGYSLTFSTGGGPFLGDLKHFGLMGVLEAPVPQANNKVPAIVYCIYQQMFASLVPAVLIGAAAERGRVGPAILFFFAWGTLVYNPIARWVWAPEGWAFKLGVLDYAGGGPIEICSGVTGMVYSIFLGKRRGFGTERLAYKPHSISNIFIGTVLLWAGWLGFNGGSTFAANLKAGLAILNTNLAASMAGATWMLLDYRLERKWSAVGFCTGAICGLVAITPAAGYVGAPASIFIGVVASAFSNLMTSLKSFFGFDDAMDIYACHGVAGIVGLVFTGVFAQSSVTFNDAYTVIPGGWLDRNWIQVGYQFAWICACWGWTFVMTYAIMFLINLIPGCKFRADEEAEIVGMDEAECGECTCFSFSLIRPKSHS